MREGLANGRKVIMYAAHNVLQYSGADWSLKRRDRTGRRGGRGMHGKNQAENQAGELLNTEGIITAVGSDILPPCDRSYIYA